MLNGAQRRNSLDGLRHSVVMMASAARAFPAGVGPIHAEPVGLVTSQPLGLSALVRWRLSLSSRFIWAARDCEAAP